jgi:hypothetical protein
VLGGSQENSKGQSSHQNETVKFLAAAWFNLVQRRGGPWRLSINWIMYSDRRLLVVYLVIMKVEIRSWKIVPGIQTSCQGKIHDSLDSYKLVSAEHQNSSKFAGQLIR